MKVYVLIGEEWTGSGTERRVLGVYSTPEKAHLADAEGWDSFYVESFEVDL